MKKAGKKTFSHLFFSCVTACSMASTVSYAETQQGACQYEQGTIAITPLTLNISTLPKRFRHKDAKINGFKIDPFKGTFGTGLNRGDRIGIGYDLELGIFAIDNLELFTVLTYVYERGNKGAGVGTGVPTFPFGGQTISYDFKARKDAAISLGGRYFWNLEKSKWMPFVGLRGTVTRQGATKANLSFVDPTNTIFTPIGEFVLQKRKTLWGGMLQGGADYRINNCVALTFAIGLLYTTRSKLHYVTIPGTIPQSYQDYYNKWIVPIQFSVRITF